MSEGPTDTDKKDNLPEPVRGSVPVPVADSERYIHSHVFDKLVEGPDDISGLVAYGLYQQRKRTWISACQQKDGCLPSEAEVKNYSFGYQEDVLQSLKHEADAVLFRFAENMMEQQIEQMAGAAFNARTVDEISDLKKQIRKVGSYRHHIVGDVAGFVVLVLVAAFVGFAFAHEPTLHDAIGWMFNPQQHAAISPSTGGKLGE